MRRETAARNGQWGRQGHEVHTIIRWGQAMASLEMVRPGLERMKLRDFEGNAIRFEARRRRFEEDAVRVYGKMWGGFRRIFWKLFSVIFLKYVIQNIFRIKYYRNFRREIFFERGTERKKGGARKKSPLFYCVNNCIWASLKLEITLKSLKWYLLEKVSQTLKWNNKICM